MRWMLRITLFVTLGVVALLGVAMFVLYRASQQVPEFYREALVADPVAQKKAAERMLDNATSLNNAVQREGQWHAVFTADEVNGWLAIDEPKNQEKLLPTELHDPRVRIEPNGITMACRLEQTGFQTVISLEVDIYLDAPDVIALRVRKARAGAIPWSLQRVLNGISAAGSRSNLRVEWRQADGDPVALLKLPSTGDRYGRVFRIETIQLERGEIRIAGKTELEGK